VAGRINQLCKQCNTTQQPEAHAERGQYYMQIESYWILHAVVMYLYALVVVVCTCRLDHLWKGLNLDNWLSGGSRESISPAWSGRWLNLDQAEWIDGWPTVYPFCYATSFHSKVSGSSALLMMMISRFCACLGLPMNKNLFKIIKDLKEEALQQCLKVSTLYSFETT
jgi:hypothetical protein